MEYLFLDLLTRRVRPDVDELFAVHEAGHFLVGYLTGFMPKGYVLRATDTIKQYVGSYM